MFNQQFPVTATADYYSAPIHRAFKDATVGHGYLAGTTAPAAHLKAASLDQRLINGEPAFASRADTNAGVGDQARPGTADAHLSSSPRATADEHTGCLEWTGILDGDAAAILDRKKSIAEIAYGEIAGCYAPRRVITHPHRDGRQAA